MINCPKKAMDTIKMLCKKYRKDSIDETTLLSNFNTIKCTHIDKLNHINDVMLSLYAHAFFCLFYNFNVRKFALESDVKIVMFRKVCKEIKGVWVREDTKMERYVIAVGLFSINDPDRFVNKN